MFESFLLLLLVMEPPTMRDREVGETSHCVIFTEEQALSLMEAAIIISAERGLPEVGRWAPGLIIA